MFRLLPGDPPASHPVCCPLSQDDLSNCLGDLAALTNFGGETLQPQIDRAAEALHELPQVRAELERVCMDRVDTLSELRLVRDAADEERRSNMSAVQTISSQVPPRHAGHNHDHAHVRPPQSRSQPPSTPPCPLAPSL